ncbi:hypothetical protein BX600DRAFT_506774 [Xylariales sp. PMI_506]|nr:hypothetical protein BX600DRAFT_506774 [Xylariales sp. PMI_506]
MPYTDNLYSWNDDSDDDYAEQLSPTNGYFTSSSQSHSVPDVPNVMVQDPTLEQAELDGQAKAREAEEESQSNHARCSPDAHSRGHSRTESGNFSIQSYSPRQVYTPPVSYPASTSPTSPSHQTMQTTSSRGRSFSVYSEAPPAYTPPQTSPLTSGSHISTARNYNTFIPIMGVETDPLLARAPESMGGEPDDENPIPRPRWQGRVKRRLSSWLSWRLIFVAAVIFTLFVGLSPSIYSITLKQTEERIKPELPDDGPKHPSTPGSHPSGPLPPTYCRGSGYRFPDQILAVDFTKEKTVSFIQKISTQSGNRHVSVGGQVNIRRVEDGGYPRILLEAVTNLKDLPIDVMVDQDEQRMRVTVPSAVDWHDNPDHPCVELRATIWVPEDSELYQLTVSTVQLDILLLDDLSLHVGDTSKFVAVSGGVKSGTEASLVYNGLEGIPLPYDETPNAPDLGYSPSKPTYKFGSRVTEVSTTSGNIKGTWSLFDKLAIHSTSGGIGVSISPQPLLDSKPNPAVLTLKTTSGPIRAHEPIDAHDQIPIREYQVELHSVSGDIQSSLVFGSSITSKTTSGKIAVRLLPVIDSTRFNPSSPAQLETITTSGKTDVQVLDPLWYGKNSEILSVDCFDCLAAAHRTMSAAIGLTYPQSWVGNLEASSTSGSLTVRGKDVRITRSSGGWGSQKIAAYKGRDGGASTISVKGVSGNLNALLGDE